MANMKYGHLFQPVHFGSVKPELEKMLIGPGNARQEIRLNGPDHLRGINLNLSWGIHTEAGDWHNFDLDPHVHPYPECFLFVGLDTANVNYLGAAVDCCLGEEQEIYSFDEPTAIVIPAGLPHAPISTKRMYSPRGFGFWAIELSPSPDITWLGRGVSNLSVEQRRQMPEGIKFAPADKLLKTKPAGTTGKYAHLVKPLKSGLLFERGQYSRTRFTPEQLEQMELAIRQSGEKPGPGNPDNLAALAGSDLEGMDVSIFWGFCSRPGLWRRGVGAHTHGSDEILIYLGTDPSRPDYLGAEIEFEMGEEHERHCIDRPTAVICPAGVPHTPQVTLWVDKPFAYCAINLSGERPLGAVD